MTAIGRPEQYGEFRRLALASPSRLGGHAHNNVLVVIAETAAENVDAARIARIGLDLDPQADRMVARNVELVWRQRGYFYAVDKRALRGYAKTLQLAVLAAFELPPVG